jgi:hypothetical protein
MLPVFVPGVGTAMASALKIQIFIFGVEFTKLCTEFLPSFAHILKRANGRLPLDPASQFVERMAIAPVWVFHRRR